MQTPRLYHGNDSIFLAHQVAGQGTLGEEQGAGQMITSTTNSRVKIVRRLQADRRFRERESLFVVEGDRWVADVLDAGLTPTDVFVVESWTNETLFGRISPTFVTDTVMAHMSDVETPPGILAIVPMPRLALPEQPTLLLILDRITTPGNLGTLLRTAAAAGVDGVLLAPGCVDAFNPKVVRGGMGAQLRLPLVNAAWLRIAELTENLDVWAAAGDGVQIYTAVDWQQPAALIIGNEARGIGKSAESISAGTISIPMAATTESLNAAMAGAIILFEAARQRHFATH